jgi:hypothetical protein
MKLISELIFDRLSERFDTHYAATHDKSTVVGRPVFYERSRDFNGHICILSPWDTVWELPDSGVFVCVGELPEGLSLRNTELMTVPGDVPVNTLFNALQDIFDYYDAWEDELNTIIDADRGYSEIIQSSTRYLDCPISIVDDEFTIIAISEHSSVEFRDDINRDKVSSSIMNELISDPLFSKGLHNNDVFEFNISGELFFSYNFKKDGKYLGRLTLYLKDKQSGNTYKFLFRFLAHKIEVMLRKLGSFLLHKEAFSSLREILSGCLNNKAPDRQYIELRLSENGWSYDDSYMLIRLQPEFRHEWQLHAMYLIPLIERQWPGACAAESGQYVVVLLNQNVYDSKNDKGFLQELAYFLRDGLMLAGISRSFTGFGQLTSYYKQTELAVSLGRDADPMCWYYCFDDYALSCWLNYGVLSFTPEQICSKILIDLIACDRDNNTEYYKTLRTFYNNKFSFTHAAESLYIHRTTLIKRIERIVELTKLNLDDPDGNLYIELSFRYLDKVRPQSAAPDA